MAEKTSSEKKRRPEDRKRAVNKPVRSAVKTHIATAVRLMDTKLEEAQKAVIVAVRALDRAAEKGVIHKNNAARRKSRLMKKLNEAMPQAKAPQPQATEQETAQ